MTLTLVFTLVVTLCLLLIGTTVKADLPVHCLAKQVKGVWGFQLAALRATDEITPDTIRQCTRDYIRESMKDSLSTTAVLEILPPNRTFVRFVSGTSLNIKENIDNSSPAFFTMMCDQGFEIKTKDGWTFFAFSKYTHMSKKLVRSECDSTMVGWYHDKSLKEWGCFVGYKLERKEGDWKIHVPINDLINFADNVHLTDKDFQKLNEQKMNQDMVASQANNDEELQAYTEDLSFQNNHERIKEINTNQNSWSAYAYPHFEKMSKAQMNARLGSRVRAHDLDEYRNLMKKMAQQEADDDIQMTNGQNLPPKLTNERKASKLRYNFPKNFDWRNVNGTNYLSPVRDQGACGSCFAMATIDALEARVRILTKNQKKLNLAVQDIISCSPFSQQCHGGFPYGVAKHVHDFGIVTEDCFPYVAENSTCSKKCSKPKVRARVTQYGYVGGYYSAGNEEDMMLEIMNNGPIVSSFMIQDDFKYYKDGIYRHVPGQAGYRGRENPWEATSHSICIFGWGEDEKTGELYWLVKNSWGSHWGEKTSEKSSFSKEYCHKNPKQCGGFFRVRRGVDESAIESQPISFLPVVDELM